MAQQSTTTETPWTTKTTADGRIAVFGPTRQTFFEKTLYGKPALANGQVVWVFPAMSAEKISAKVAFVNAGIAKRNAERAAQPVPSVSRSAYAPRRYATSSGWCEACEDGAINRCRRGGCY